MSAAVRFQPVRRPMFRRRTWAWIALGVALVAVVVPTLGFLGPVDWFSDFSVSPTVAYSGDINVTLSATLVGLSGPIAGAAVQFVTYPVTGAPPLVVNTSRTGPHGAAIDHFIPRSPGTYRFFARYVVPGTSEVITSPPAVIQIYLPPTI